LPPQLWPPNSADLNSVDYACGVYWSGGCIALVTSITSKYVS